MRQCRLFIDALSNIKSFSHFFIELTAHAVRFVISDALKIRQMKIKVASQDSPKPFDQMRAEISTNFRLSGPM